MPPLPPTTQTLTNRLNSLSESNKSINQLVQRLAKLDFQPGSQPLNAEEGDIRLELSAEIHESLKQVEEELELVKQEVEDVIQVSGSANRRRDSAKEGERSRLAVLLARLTEDLRLTRLQYRQAQLTAKHNAEKAKLKERELLFSNLQSGTSSPSSLHRRKSHNTGLSEGEVVTQASSDVTAALRRTHELMQSELSRSRFAQETLETSTAALADLGEKYSDLNTLLANSKNLIGTLLKSQKSDTWYLETTFYILITTVIWLAFRRWLYGPITWLIIWPLKIFFRIVFGVIGLSSAASASSSVAPSEPSTSLIIKPSATGGIPRREINQNKQPNQPYIRVGGGGRGYAQDPSPPESLSQKVGQMAELNQQQQDQQPAGEPVRRGDGTVLQESDKPRNPKKRMWEENVEREKYEQGQQQQQGQQEQTQQQGEGQGNKDKDEL